MDKNQDYLNVLRKINNKPNLTQRKLAQELGFSLGKLNYCIKALKMKGLVKIKNFKKIQIKFIIFTFLHQKEYQEKLSLFIILCKEK